MSPIRPHVLSFQVVLRQFPVLPAVLLRYLFYYPRCLFDRACGRSLKFEEYVFGRWILTCGSVWSELVGGFDELRVY